MICMPKPIASEQLVLYYTVILFYYLYVECKNQRYRVPRRDTADQIMMPAQMSNQVEKRRPQRGI